MKTLSVDRCMRYYAQNKRSFPKTEHSPNKRIEQKFNPLWEESKLVNIYLEYITTYELYTHSPVTETQDN